MKTFVGLSFAVIGEQVCALGTSNAALVALDGLSAQQALEFLWATRQPQTVMVSFGFAVDLEMLFSALGTRQKDVLWGINLGEYPLPKDYREMLIRRLEEEALVAENNPLAEEMAPPSVKIQAGGFSLRYMPGKMLRLAQKREGLNCYDISGFFPGATLARAALDYLGESIPLVEKNLLPLWQQGLAIEIAGAQMARARTIAALANKVRECIEPLGLSPRAWYGPAAIAGNALGAWGARKQARKLTEKNAHPQLLKAIDCSYFGGRVEAIRLGTIADIKTYDLNSAYAYATTLLSQFYAPPRFTRDYDRECPFACWLVEYQLPADTHLGIVPTRGTRGGISFAASGKGWFWAPEVDFLVTRYPGCARIEEGFVTPNYRPVSFGAEIQKMYDYRQLLKSRGDQGEKIIKLALTNLYGKFAQNRGSAFYQCRAWAGWITSLVRRLMLEAVEGREHHCIAFLQDAIHLSGAPASRVRVGQGLGEWKAASFDEGLYIAPGIYQLRQGGERRDKTCGSNSGLDFDSMARQLSERQVSTLSRTFFVSWQMARNAPVAYERDYLREVTEELTIIPSQLQARNYRSDFHWSKEARDSTILQEWSGLLSARYRPGLKAAGNSHLRLQDGQWN